MKRSSVFTDSELDYLHGDRRLGRVATVGADGAPHVVPSGWSHNRDEDTIDIRGMNLAATKKFKDVARNRRAAIVIDDLASISPWRPRAIEISGQADALHDPEPVIRIHPDRVVSWGLD
jgi:pyridoxamine 5'-phosphate oxidase family protein